MRPWHTSNMNVNLSCPAVSSAQTGICDDCFAIHQVEFLEGARDTFSRSPHAKIDRTEEAFQSMCNVMKVEVLSRNIACLFFCRSLWSSCSLSDD